MGDFSDLWRTRISKTNQIPAYSLAENSETPNAKVMRSGRREVEREICQEEAEEEGEKRRSRRGRRNRCRIKDKQSKKKH